MTNICNIKTLRKYLIKTIVLSSFFRQFFPKPLLTKPHVAKSVTKAFPINFK